MQNTDIEVNIPIITEKMNTESIKIFQDMPQSYIIPQKYVEKHNVSPEIIGQELQEHFDALFSATQSACFEFTYVIDTRDPQSERICYHQGIESYLGYTSTDINMGWLMEALHPEERRILNRLSVCMRDFFKSYNAGYSFSIMHQIKKANGNYIKILRKIHPILIDQSSNRQLLACFCSDISNHAFLEKVTLDVILHPKATLNKAEVLAHFAHLLPEKPVELTNREIQVIKIWCETDSARVAAERLGITVRTLETHLKHARRKLNVKRSLDLVVFAKDQNLI